MSCLTFAVMAGPCYNIYDDLFPHSLRRRKGITSSPQTVIWNKQNPLEEHFSHTLLEGRSSSSSSSNQSENGLPRTGSSPLAVPGRRLVARHHCSLFSQLAFQLRLLVFSRVPGSQQNTIGPVRRSPRTTAAGRSSQAAAASTTTPTSLRLWPLLPRHRRWPQPSTILCPSVSRRRGLEDGCK